MACGVFQDGAAKVLDADINKWVMYEAEPSVWFLMVRLSRLVAGLHPAVEGPQHDDEAHHSLQAVSTYMKEAQPLHWLAINFFNFL